MTDAPLRDALVQTMRSLEAAGLNVGTTGNASVRTAKGLLITPSGIPVSALTAERMVALALDGSPLGAGRPSSEWRFHCDIFRDRPEVEAIVHTHSPHATALATTGRGIPAFHYMVAVAGGRDIRCAPYATFGTEALSAAAVAALVDRRACLLANHGVIATGNTLAAALGLAGYVENLAQMYIAALGIGDVQLLDDLEMKVVLERFRDYGDQAMQRVDQTAPDGERASL